MSIETDQAALRAAREAAAVLALDPVARKAFGAQLAMSPERWSERFVEVLVDAAANARRRRDLTMVTEPLDASVRDLLLARRFDVVFSMREAFAAVLASGVSTVGAEATALRRDLTGGMFSPETMRLLVREAERIPQAVAGVEPAAVDLDGVARGVTAVLADVGVSHLEAVLDVLPAVSHEDLRKSLLGYLERVLPGNETLIAERTMAMELGVARPILRMLSAARSHGATEALRRLAGGGNPGLRCECIALLAPSPEQMRDELLALAEAPDPSLRSAALRTLASYQVRGAGPLLVRRVQDAAFHTLPIDERRELLDALHVLHPPRAEALAIELLGKHGLLSDDALDQTRVVCAEMLARTATSMEALEAVMGAGRRRPWNSAFLRDAAGQSAEPIATRLGKRITASGEIL
jgi:hypothetical protein